MNKKIYFSVILACYSIIAHSSHHFTQYQTYQYNRESYYPTGRGIFQLEDGTYPIENTDTKQQPQQETKPKTEVSPSNTNKQLSNDSFSSSSQSVASNSLNSSNSSSNSRCILIPSNTPTNSANPKKRCSPNPVNLTEQTKRVSLILDFCNNTTFDTARKLTRQ